MTIDLSNQIKALLAGKSKVKILSGTFVSATATQLVVDCGNGRISCFPLVSYLPLVNETVYVMFIDDVPYVTGPTQVKPNQGTVVSASGGLVTLTVATGTIILPYTTTLTPTAGQVMYLIWQGGQGFAVSVMSVQPATVAPPVKVVSTVKSHTDVFKANASGSYQSGKFWTAEVYSSTGNIAEWVYGHKMADTIPSSAVIHSVEIYCSMNQIFGTSPNFALHSDQTLSGSPSLGGVTVINIAQKTWVSLPASYGNALKRGGGSYGVGVAHGGFQIFKSIAEDGWSGALRIRSTY